MLGCLNQNLKSFDFICRCLCIIWRENHLMDVSLVNPWSQLNLNISARQARHEYSILKVNPWPTIQFTQYQLSMHVMLGVVMQVIIPHMIYLFYTWSTMNEMQRYQTSGSVSQTPPDSQVNISGSFSVINEVFLVVSHRFYIMPGQCHAKRSLS